MKRYVLALGVCVFALILIQAGCQRDAAKKGPPDKAASDSKTPVAEGASGEEAEIKESLAKLSPEDRKLAETQKFCAVLGKESRLGSMGAPVKIMLKGEPVFLCCKSCTKKAQDHPDDTLARVKEFRAAK